MVKYYTVKNLIELLQGIPDNFKDSMIFVNHKNNISFFMDYENGELNITNVDAKVEEISKARIS